MSMNFEDKSGEPRDLEDLDQAIKWCQQRIIKFDLPPDGLLVMPIILDCLKAYRNVVARMKQ
jgi:hypothetical protein